MGHGVRARWGSTGGWMGEAGCLMMGCEIGEEILWGSAGEGLEKFDRRPRRE